MGSGECVPLKRELIASVHKSSEEEEGGKERRDTSVYKFCNKNPRSY